MRKISLKIAVLSGMGIIFYFAKPLSTEPQPNADSLLRIVGIVIAIIALLYLIMEARGNMPFFYGSSQSGGSNANAAVVAGLAVALIAASWAQLFLGFVIASLIIIAVTYLVKKKR